MSPIASECRWFNSGRRRGQTRIGFMRVRWSIAAIALSLSGLAGCAELQEVKIDFRNRYLAHEAWRDLREVYCDMNYEKDFGRGFRTGYYDVASGGNGCPPILPPQRYWSVRYMSTEGRARTEAWFAGFRYGAMVAEQDGIGVFIELPTSLPSQPGDYDRPKHGPDPPPEEETVPIEDNPSPEDKYEVLPPPDEGSMEGAEDAPALPEPAATDSDSVPAQPFIPINPAK